MRLTSVHTHIMKYLFYRKKGPIIINTYFVCCVCFTSRYIQTIVDIYLYTWFYLVSYYQYNICIYAVVTQTIGLVFASLLHIKTNMVSSLSIEFCALNRKYLKSLRLLDSFSFHKIISYNKIKEVWTLSKGRFK